MSLSARHGDTESCLQQGAAELLVAAGFPADAVPALLDFDEASFQWTRSVMKSEFLRAVLRRLRLDLDVAHFHALTALARIQGGIGRPAGEATIGLVAEEMNVDPSRASRLVADLVGRGFLRREVSQADGRRAILTLTGEGREVLLAFRREKFAILMRVFRDWDAAAIRQFAVDLRTYARGVQAALDHMGAGDDREAARSGEGASG